MSEGIGASDLNGCGSSKNGWFNYRQGRPVLGLLCLDDGMGIAAPASPPQLDKGTYVCMYSTYNRP